MKVPIPEMLADELMVFWADIFGDFDLSKEELLGSEHEHNSLYIYIKRYYDNIAGTCTVTVSSNNPSIGGLGEVATNSQFRRSGIATQLCSEAIEEFRIHGGEALFLGTGNPEAARVYRRLGWMKLAGANVMVNMTNGSPEEFLINHFSSDIKPVVRVGNPDFHLQMIPLILSPNNWQVLDANLGIFSTRYKVQNSCMSLYPRYRSLSEGNRGAWCGAIANSGCVVGLSSVCLDKEGGYSVDGFTHESHRYVWSDLIQKAFDWGESHRSGRCYAKVSIEDEEKMSLFEEIGYRKLGTFDTFELDGHQGGQIGATVQPNRRVNYIRMELT